MSNLQHNIVIPKTMVELEALPPSARLPHTIALALCFKPRNLEEGLAAVEGVFANERNAILQLRNSSISGQMLWLAVACAIGFNTVKSGYWPIAVVIAIIWTITAVAKYKRYQAMRSTRFAELAFMNPQTPYEAQPYVEAAMFQSYLKTLEGEAASPWALLDDLHQRYPPAIIEKVQASR